MQDVSAGSSVVCVLRDCYGGHSVGETPGPIPNPEAKAHCADGTALVRVWESRSPPDIIYVPEPPNHRFGGSDA